MLDEQQQIQNLNQFIQFFQSAQSPKNEPLINQMSQSFLQNQSPQYLNQYLQQQLESEPENQLNFDCKGTFGLRNEQLLDQPSLRQSNYLLQRQFSLESNKFFSESPAIRQLFKEQNNDSLSPFNQQLYEKAKQLMGIDFSNNQKSTPMGQGFSNFSKALQNAIGNIEVENSPQQQQKNQGRSLQNFDISPLFSNLKLYEIANSQLNQIDCNQIKQGLLQQGLEQVSEEKNISFELEEINQNKTKKEVLTGEEKRNISLAFRNVKINFASGIKDFVKFQILLLKKKGQIQKLNEFQEIYVWLNENSKELRCSEGWQAQFILQYLRKKLIETGKFGKQFQQIAYQFFKKSFAFTYIKYSRIQEQYKGVHYQQIPKFLNALQNLKLFNANYFHT